MSQRLRDLAVGEWFVLANVGRQAATYRVAAGRTKEGGVLVEQRGKESVGKWYRAQEWHPEIRVRRIETRGVLAEVADDER